MNNFKLTRNSMSGNTIEFESDGSVQEYMYDVDNKIANIIEQLQQENKQLQARIEFAVEDLNQLQGEIFGGDEYLNWIVSEIEKVKIRLGEEK